MNQIHSICITFNSFPILSRSSCKKKKKNAASESIVHYVFRNIVYFLFYFHLFWWRNIVRFRCIFQFRYGRKKKIFRKLPIGIYWPGKEIWRMQVVHIVDWCESMIMIIQMLFRNLINIEVMSECVVAQRRCAQNRKRVNICVCVCMDVGSHIVNYYCFVSWFEWSNKN